MERQYPPFGIVPAPLAGDLQVLGRADHTAVSLAGFFAVPEGVLATLFVVTSAADLQGSRFAFEELDGPVRAGGLEVWAEWAEPGSLAAVRGPAHLASGGGGADGGVDARSYVVWFPVDIPALRSDLAFSMRWDQAGIAAGPLSVSATDLQRAGSSAIRV